MAGTWEGQPYEPGGFTWPIVTLLEPATCPGDLDGDGSRDTVVGLKETGGGAGHFLYRRSPP